MDMLFDEIINYDEWLRKIVYIDDDCIILKPDPNELFFYDIELNRCDTIESVVGWVMHLIVKTWVTKEIIERFISIAVDHHKLKTEFK